MGISRPCIYGRRAGQSRRAAQRLSRSWPDPDEPEERRRLIERIGGRVVPKIEKKKVGGKPVEIEREETIGGILLWGRDPSPTCSFSATRFPRVSFRHPWSARHV